ncbi:choice-of-anchor L domain-containing protein [Bradyrhizobium sp. th.b2]|uniref:choice-of-anchor L domain-containing protein n=1 Tax=Bradyrhizobium sp. th-b2 TaxID=172088 RepID=UPI0012EC641E|nr:choice-of-anchor L domain-containing protein [Bradyrhizobium sp. th.b2]
MALNTLTAVDGTSLTGKTTLLNYLNTLTAGGLSGISISSIDYVGGTASTSTFDSLNLSGSVNFGKGILLTSGNGTPPRTNTSSSYGVDLGLPGNSSLTTFAQNAFPGAGSTNDASVITLHINVTDPNVQSIRFNVAFGSDEYPEFSNTSFVDIGAVWENGVNYALINGQANQPLSVTQTNINLNNFINNQSGALAIEYDGLVNAQTVFVPVHFGDNVISLGVADTGDGIYDSGLFILGLASSTSSAAGTFQQVLGTSASDILVGSTNNELFDAGAGNDGIWGYGGSDLAYDGDGNDVSVMGSGNDQVFGGNGNDYAYLYGGNDTAYGGAGTDVLIGGGGDDVLVGDSGFNYLFGGDGNDILYGNGGTSPTDVNVMFGEAGSDVLIGGAGTNYFYGGAGVDSMYGGSGINIFISSGETDGNVISGGSGQNYVYGSNGGDTVTGGVSTDVFLMGSGSDVISGGGGVDYAWGGGGSDIFSISDTVPEVMVIQDFNTGGVNDIVNFAGTSLHSFADVQAASFYSAGINTTIITDAAGSAVWLIGKAPGDLNASMFSFS